LGEQFIGQNVDVMVAQFGPPASTFKMSSGGASYQWQLAGGAFVACRATCFIEIVIEFPLARDKTRQPMARFGPVLGPMF
jgi:hypothetical protein